MAQETHSTGALYVGDVVGHGAHTHHRSRVEPWDTYEFGGSDDGFNPLGTGPDLEIKPRDTVQALMHKTEES